MQLAKNLFLSRDKTLSRKLEEVVLTDYLEQTFSKDELMELYLNVIEFGPGRVRHHGGGGALLRPHARRSCTSGSACFSRPSFPRPFATARCARTGEVPEGWMRTLRTLMQIAHHYGRITDAELADAEKEPIVFWRGGESAPAATARVAPRHGTSTATTDDVNTAPPLDAPASP